MENRTHRFNVLLSDDEYNELHRRAEAKGINVSDYFRQWLRDRWLKGQPSNLDPNPDHSAKRAPRRTRTTR